MYDSRDYVREGADNIERRYAYNFDTVLRGYMMRAFRPFLPTGRAVEVGCYEGDFTALLAPFYMDLTVVDVLESALARTQERVGTIHAIQGTVESIDLPAASFDAAFLIHVLEHLDDPIAVLRRIGTWLRPGGRLFLACPNANAASRQIAVKMGLISRTIAITPGERAQGHRRTYTRDTLERDVRAAGLSVHHGGGVFFKALANFQFDRLLNTDIISTAYLDGCYELGTIYPDLCASVFLVCTRGPEWGRSGTFEVFEMSDGTTP
jgi:2-polyprenyl-3-methyl-5-hydroxy-6-metoxy-1,4-benzoquinol methylase